MRLKRPDDNHLFVVSAPSGSGKTSLIKRALMQIKDLKLSISHTTRPPRPREVEGQDYFFVDKSTFREMIARSDFLEYAVVFAEYYGTSKFYIENELNQGHDLMMEIDWQGARQIKAHYADTFAFFVLPPSIRTLQERLEKRAQDSEEVIRLRMKQALSEARHFDEYDYVIVNDDFDRASTEFIAVLTGRISEIEIEESRKLLDKTILSLGLNHSVGD